VDDRLGPRRAFGPPSHDVSTRCPCTLPADRDIQRLRYPVAHTQSNAHPGGERPTRKGGLRARRAVMSAVRDADEWGGEQELLRLQAILNDQAEKMEWRREAERAETRLATRAGAPDATKGAARPSVPAFWTAGQDTIGDSVRPDPPDLNHRVTSVHRGRLRHTREVGNSCWERAWLNLHASRVPKDSGSGS
jgi:hypothetical protein